MMPPIEAQVAKLHGFKNKRLASSTPPPVMGLILAGSGPDRHLTPYAVHHIVTCDYPGPCITGKAIDHHSVAMFTGKSQVHQQVRWPEFIFPDGVCWTLFGCTIGAEIIMPGPPPFSRRRKITL